MIAQTIILYSHEDRPTFVVFGLSDRAFNAGFRVLNPEFKTHAGKVAEDTELLNEWIENNIETSDPGDFHNYSANKPMNPRERRVWKATNGLDR